MSNSIASTSYTQSDETLRTTLGKLQKALTNSALNSGGLVIGSTDASKIKIANTVYYMIEGVMKVKTTAEITLTTDESVTADKFNIILVSLDADGDATLTAGTEAATLAGVTIGSAPVDDVVIGFVIINPTGTGNFVGGTTDLDDATVVPNAVYVNCVGASANLGLALSSL